jgi:4-hydroxybenzoyl-CoA thioesterase
MDERGALNVRDKTTFRRERTIRLHHCNPAGIVFYPQYLVILHEFIECWFDENHMGISSASAASASP